MVSLDDVHEIYAIVSAGAACGNERVLEIVNLRLIIRQVSSCGTEHLVRVRKIKSPLPARNILW